MKVADGEHIRKVFVLSADDVAAGAEVTERVEATVGSTGSPTDASCRSLSLPVTEPVEASKRPSGAPYFANNAAELRL